MSEKMAQQIIDNYVATTLALRASSETPAAVVDQNLDMYRSERLDIFIRWENAKFSLQELPLEYKLKAIQAIDAITA
ncbi:hypothetical protein [Paenibacillus xylanexedens]|uniref:hypothetical protein n=1 Tax=Paenibacillus xylanexedens TaxID=528191 RepID=UPI0011AB14A8|nr:hypothetical protein [Paenibacillus xylanexedens]